MVTVGGKGAEEQPIRNKDRVERWSDERASKPNHRMYMESRQAGLGT